VGAWGERPMNRNIVQQGYVVFEAVGVKRRRGEGWSVGLGEGSSLPSPPSLHPLPPLSECFQSAGSRLTLPQALTEWWQRAQAGWGGQALPVEHGLGW